VRACACVCVCMCVYVCVCVSSLDDLEVLKLQFPEVLTAMKSWKKISLSRDCPVLELQVG
jgi:hypothetical protein